MNIIFSLVFAGLTLVALSLQRAYAALPVRELRHRSRGNDPLATNLHLAATYGVSLRVILWVLVIMSSAGFFVFTARHASPLVSFGLSCLLVWVGFVWLANKQSRDIGLRLAGLLAPIFAWILQYLHSPIQWLATLTHRWSSKDGHTGLYDKEDLLTLINDQNSQTDNHMSQEELELAFHALTFGDKLVSDYLTPKRKVKMVGVTDSIGPILMSELHASGFSRFPVYKSKKDAIVGTLFLKDLVKTSTTAKVSEVMHSQVCYVHEDQTLHDALQAILKTHHHLLIVVNSLEEYVGVITIEDVFGQIIGQPIRDEFDQYDDLQAVAHRAANQPVAAEISPEASEEPTEVVE